MKQALLVNLFAGPSALKSTTAAGVFTLLKLHGVECDSPHEFPKDLVWEESCSMMNDQNYVFGNQYHRIWRVKNKVDVILVDSPILFSVVYRKEGLGQKFIDHVVEMHNQFDNVNVFLERNLEKGFTKNGRDHDLKESLELDKQIKEVLNKYCTPYYTFKSGTETINNLTTLILGRLGLQLNYKLEKLK